MAVVVHAIVPRLASVSPLTRPTTVDVIAGIGAPNATFALLAVMVSGAWFTSSEPMALLGAKVPCAAKLATSACVPTAGFSSVNTAAPPVRAWLRGAPPSTVKVTLPVTVPAPEVTFTVTTPSCPYVIAGAVMVVVVGVAGNTSRGADGDSPAAFRL